MLHAKIEIREGSGAFHKKIEEIPLRHECNEFAVGRHVFEIRGLECEIAEDSSHGRQLLMRQFQEVFQKSELIHQLERGRMHCIAAKIAEKVIVLLEDRDGYACPSQQVAEH